MKKVVKYSQTNWQFKQPRAETDIKGNVSNSNLYHNESIFDLNSAHTKTRQKEAHQAKLAKKGLQQSNVYLKNDHWNKKEMSDKAHKWQEYKQKQEGSQKSGRWNNSIKFDCDPRFQTYRNIRSSSHESYKGGPIAPTIKSERNLMSHFIKKSNFEMGYVAGAS